MNRPVISIVQTTLFELLLYLTNAADEPPVDKACFCDEFIEIDSELD